MASTYTNIGIEKIGAYEQEDTWGPTTNENFDYFDEAIDGHIALALTTTAETLITVDGSSDETLAAGGRHKVVKFTGTPGGTCTVTIEPADMQKVYIMYNNTDQSVIIKQGSAGSTVTILSGNKTTLFCDGAGTTDGAVIEVGYTHPTYNGDDISIATTALTGATIFDDIDLVVTTDATGHVTAASGAVSTRELTPADIGANGIIGTDTDLNTSGAQVIDIITMTDGVIQNAITTRNLTVGDIGAQAAGTYNTIIGTDTDINTSGATIIDNIYVTDGVITSMGTRALTINDLGSSTIRQVQYYNTTSNLAVTSDWVNYMSDSITSTGGQITILMVISSNMPTPSAINYQLYRGTTFIFENVTQIYPYSGTVSILYTDAPGAGTDIYYLKVRNIFNDGIIYNGAMTLMEH